MIKIRSTPWDDAHFNLKTGRVTLEQRINNEDIKQIYLKAQEFDMLVIDNKSGELINDQQLSRLKGNYLCDMLIKFYYLLDKVVQHKVEDTSIYIVDEYKGSQDVLKIAETAYQYSRFKMDPFLNKEKSNTIYIEWCKQAFLKKGKYFLLYECNDQIEGYILFHKEDTKMIIELIATNPCVQHRGIGHKMMERLKMYSIDEGIEEIEVGTQMHNKPAIHFYQKEGFQVGSVQTVYHYWPNF